ncbi:MAG: Ig-like domain-containing protein [Myxococcota bacterium]
MRSRSPFIFSLVAALTTGCDQTPQTSRAAPAEDFTYAHTVRIVIPQNGDAVDGTFTIKYDAGADVADVRFELEGQPLTILEHDRDARVMTASAPSGTQTLQMFGLDADGADVSKHRARIRVGADGPWVAITSPTAGDTVSNPVTFSVNMDDNLDRVELLADDWYLGDVNSDGLLTYSFVGTGFTRDIEAVGYIDGQPVARDEISLTVLDGTEPIDPDAAFNQIMMDLAQSYPTDGTYGYYWPAQSEWNGHPSDIYYQGELYSRGDRRNRSFCVGLTFEVFMRAFEIADRQTGGSGSLNGMTMQDLDDMRILWFIVNLNGGENVDALVNYGLGQQITDFEDAQPGDVVQFWRHSGSGHNNLFVSWERDSRDQIIGLTYWSTQGTTDGIGYHTEYFGSSGSRINPSLVYIARPYMPTDWQPWY